jgi:hypothetical protein
MDSLTPGSAKESARSGQGTSLSPRPPRWLPMRPWGLYSALLPEGLRDTVYVNQRSNERSARGAACGYETSSYLPPVVELRFEERGASK